MSPRPTNSTKEGCDGIPDSDAAHAQPLSNSQLQVEQWQPLEHQGYQVGDEEGTWVGERLEVRDQAEGSGSQVKEMYLSCTVKHGSFWAIRQLPRVGIKIHVKIIYF